MTLTQRCAQSLSRKVYEPLVDERAENLRIRAREGERRPEGLSGLNMRAWIMGAAERAEERNRKAMTA